jgi:O-antigen/teichoic acid export membrane protein
LTLTLVTLLLGLQTGLLNRPYAVISASRNGDSYKQYVTSVAGAQCLSAVAIIALLWLAAFAIQVAGASEVAALAAVAGPAITCWGLQEFLRQVLYAEGRLRAALINDAVSYGGQLVAIIVLYLAGALTPVSAFAAIAATSFVAVIVGLYQVRGSLARRLDWRVFRADAAENWRFGRWLAGGALMVSAVELANAWMIAGFVSIVATGVMRAAMTMLGPTHILLKTMDLTLTPMAARVVEREGIGGLKRLVLKIFIVTAPLMAGYCLIVSILSAELLMLLYGSEYAGYAWLVRLIALAYFCFYIYEPVSIACAALRRSDTLFRAQFSQALFVLTIGVVATYALGLLGTVLTMTGTALTQNFVIWRSYLREVSRDTKHADATAIPAEKGIYNGAAVN